MAVLFNSNEGCYVFTNLKVMFSTLNNHEVLTHCDRDRKVDKYTYACLLLRKIGLGPATYLLVRNPYARIVSFFEDKFRSHPVLERERGFTGFDEWQDCQQIFFDQLDIDSSIDSPEIISRQLEAVSFGEMVEVLPEVYRNDPHLRPQIEICKLRWRQLSLHIRFDRIIPIEEMDAAFMRERLGVDITQRYNSTDRSSYEKYLSPDTLPVLNAVYCKDFECFGYESHDVVSNSPTLAPPNSPSSPLSLWSDR